MPTLEIWDDSSDDNRRWFLARKLAILVYFLNTRTDQIGKFVMKGVTNRRFPGYNGAAPFVIVLDGVNVIEGSQAFLENRYGEEDMNFLGDSLFPHFGRYYPEYS